MVDMSSDFGDLDDDDLLQLTEEFEGSTAATDTRAAIIVDTPARGAAADVDGLEDSPSSAKRRRVGSSPFKKPQLPRSRLNKGQNKISLGCEQTSAFSTPQRAVLGLSSSASRSAITWRQSQLTSWGVSPSRPTPPRAGRDSAGYPRNDLENEDPDLAAAIKASLEVYDRNISESPLRTPSKNSERDTKAEFHYDTDDIPEDVFDSPFQATPIRTIPESPRPSTQKGLRQITLFGTAATDQPSSNTIHSPCSPRRDEPPTHHRLNRDALGTWVYPTNLGSKRDYQFNITKKALFHNLLVALPTGLGKTFIAATVMLNWYRWTMEAQIIFIAPTKPLVSQQAHACYNIAGIPRSATTILTGETGPALRAGEWTKKRVFFMTPQTLLADLTTGIADPKRVVLLVVDEAHRATGGYAYAEAVRFLERFNQSFRVLALTATPGKEVESVQEVIDNLRISKIEIRSEQSLDIRQYVHMKNTEKHTFENTAEMTRIMGLFSKALKPVVDKLASQNAYWSRDPLSVTPYGLTLARKKWAAAVSRTVNQGIKAMVNAVFSVLSSLAHALDLLKFHGIRPFYRSMAAFKNSLEGDKGGKYRRMIYDNPNFQTMMKELGKMVSTPHFTGNPKLDYLKQVVLNHFLDPKFAAGSNYTATGPDTRVMIFARFRDSAEDIVDALKDAPMVKAHVFVGKAKARNSEGMAQKRQLEVVKKFKEGEFNVLVATSVGEEGLDIGEVDLIICYDSSASPISLLQRMGRTGRKREGNIVMLFMKGKEETDYAKAVDNYLNMQKRIENATEFTFHTDKAPRILPRDVQPVVDERKINVPIENLQPDDFLPQPIQRRGVKPKRPAKQFFMPEDVETGFTTASRLHDCDSCMPRLLTRGRAKLGAPKMARPVAIADSPPDTDVFLSQKEEFELTRRYRNVGGTAPQTVRPVNFNAFSTLQHLSRPVERVQHSNRTQRFIQMMRSMRSVPPDCDLLFREKLHPNDDFLVITEHGNSTKDEPSDHDDNEVLQSQTTSLALSDSQMTMSQISIPDLMQMFGQSPGS